MNGSVGLKINLEFEAHQEGDQWVSCCHPLDLYSQGDTPEEALAALKEAAVAWFESCIERGVVRQALEECGFRLATAAEASQYDNVVALTDQAEPPRDPLKRSVEISVPAYIADAFNTVNRCVLSAGKN
jgi:predicted RNase H-like HicB family nuclease